MLFVAGLSVVVEGGFTRSSRLFCREWFPLSLELCRECWPDLLFSRECLPSGAPSETYIFMRVIDRFISSPDDFV